MANTADIADIGFRANTAELVKAKGDLEALVPAAAKVDNAVDKTEASFAALNSASEKLMAVVKGLDAASMRLAGVLNVAADSSERKAKAEMLNAAATGEAASASNVAAVAAGKETAAVNEAANANSRKGKVVSTAAAGTKAATDASLAAAAAARKEATAIDGVTNARRRQNSVPIVSAASQGRSGPWGTERAAPSPMNDNMPGAQRANVGNIAAQFQDIGVTAAMGMNPLLIALQQGTQLSAVFAASGESLGKTLRMAFLSVISPAAILTIGVVALVAAGVQMVNWAKVAQVVLNTLADILPTIAQYAALAAAGIALMYAPSVLAGLYALVTNLPLIAAGFRSIAVAIYATVGLPALLIAGLIAIVAAAIVFRDELTGILGFDIVGSAKKGVNLIIGSFVAAYHDIQFLWNSFPDIIGAAAIGAYNYAIDAMNKMMRKAMEGLNVLVDAVNVVLSKVGSKTIARFDDTSDTMEKIYNDAADRLEKAAKKRNEQLQEDLGKDYLGAIVGAIEYASSAASAKLAEIASSIDTSGGTKAKGKSDKEKFSDIISGAQQNIATLKAEGEALGLTAEAAARLRIETDLLNQAREKELKLTPAQTAELKKLAAQMATMETANKNAKFFDDLTKSANNSLAAMKQERDVIGMNETAVAQLKYETDMLNRAKQEDITLTEAQKKAIHGHAVALGNQEVATRRAKDAFDFAKSSAKDFVDTFIQGIKAGESVWKSFGDAALSVLEKIGKKLVDMAIDDLFTGGNSSSGFLSNLLNIFTKGGKAAGNAAGDSIVSATSKAISVLGSASGSSGAGVGNSVLKGGGYGNNLAANIKQLSANIGANSRDMAALMSFESGMRPDIWGGANKNYYGLIQAGANERKQYGITPGGSLASQFTGIEAFFKDRGYKPGMSGLDLYSTVNAGSPGRYNASDTANGGTWGTVRDKWEKQMGPHFERGDKLLGSFNNNLTAASDASKKAGESLGGLTTGLQETATSLTKGASSVGNSVAAGVGKMGGGGMGGGLGGGVGTGGGGFSGLFSSIFDGIGSLFSGLFDGIGSLFKGIFSIFGFSKGGAFGSKPMQFAKGGAFTSTVVSKPTLFSFAKGTQLGEMGEAGAEAIMPLKKGPDGSLGVEMYGAGNGARSSSVSNSVEVENHYHIEGAISERRIVDMVQAAADETEQSVKKKMVGWLDQYGNDGAFA